MGWQEGLSQSALEQRAGKKSTSFFTWDFSDSLTYLCAFKSIQEFRIFSSSETQPGNVFFLEWLYCRSCVQWGAAFLVSQEAESASGAILIVVAAGTAE